MKLILNKSTRSNIRDREAIYWKQKFREKWIQDGDSNTKFFHLATMIRRRRNKIDGLFNANGDWYIDPTEMKTIVDNHFQNRFSAHMEEDLRFHIPLLFLKLDQHTICQLDSDVLADEVKFALFHIGGLKAPRFDGFPAHFYQKHWNLVGADIIGIVTLSSL